MRVVKITQFGGPEFLQVEEASIPQPAANQVLIRIKAAGVNRPDVLQRKGNYPPPANAPQDIPGLEVSGIIEAVDKSVQRWKKGDKVCALISGGGYAEYVTAHTDSCLPVPDKLSFIEAAALPETVFTVWSNVFERGMLKTGETLLVHGGSSGIGITAIQLAVANGAKVIATAGSREKCEACINFGAKCINYKEEDFEKVIGPENVDVILDMIGGDYFEKNLSILRPEGRLVFINAMQGPDVSFKIRDVMSRRLTITGSTLRSRDNYFKGKLSKAVEQNVWPLIAAGKFKPVIYKTFSLANAAKAHELMEESSHIGKLVINIADD